MYFPDYQSLANMDVKARISKVAQLGKPELEFLYSNITEWNMSKEREYMLTAQAYDKNENDIKDKKRYYIDRRGVRRELESLSNTKLTHPWLRLLKNQKVSHLLSKPFTVTSEDENFSKILEEYIDKEFRRRFKNVADDSIINGIAWIQVYYDALGNLKYKRIPPEEIIPFWADADHTELEGVVRVYTIVVYLPDGGKKQIQKVEYHTVHGSWYYQMADNGLEPDPDYGPTSRGHFAVEQQRIDKNGNAINDKEGNPELETVQATWDRIPFVAFKYNSQELSLLRFIKPLIDDYDLMTSDISDVLHDTPNSIKVVRNYDGTDKGEFVQNLNTFRTAFVRGDGDMTSLNTPIDTTASEAHLARLRQDIYEAASGVDTQRNDLGNASGVSLKFRYAALDLDCSILANEFATSLEQLIWFMRVDIAGRGLGDFMDTDVEVVFNTDEIINESEVIKNAKESVGIISDETIIANHPWVTSAADEQEKLKAQQEEALRQAEQLIVTEFGNAYGEFPNQGTDPTNSINEGEDDE